MNDDPLGLKKAVSKEAAQNRLEHLRANPEQSSGVKESPSVNIKKSNPKESNVILYLENSLSRTRGAQKDNLLKLIKESGYEVDFINLESNGKLTDLLDEWVSDNEKMPVALLRWDEHGVIYSRYSKYKEITKWAYRNNVAPLTVDFGYFNHYKSYMLDLLNERSEPTTRKEMHEMSDDVPEIDEIKGKVGDHIKLVKQIYDKHRFYNSIGHKKGDYNYVAFTQSLMNGCRLMKTNSPFEWMTKVQEATSGDVIFKTQPAPFVKKDPPEDISGFNYVDHRALRSKYAKSVFSGQREILGIELNAAVATSAECCIINSSGVSSELVITGMPVIATGKSWFNTMVVFDEPKTWEGVKKMIDDKKYNVGPTRRVMRKKWVNWWVNHQFFIGEKTDLLNVYIKKFKDRETQ